MAADLWTCLDCNSITELDAHGRCGVCGSDGVARRSFEHLALVARLYREPSDAELRAAQIDYLEALYDGSTE